MGRKRTRFENLVLKLVFFRRITQKTNNLPPTNKKTNLTYIFSNTTIMPVVQTNTAAPDLTFRLLSGETFTLRDRNPKNYTIVVFYRGAHCPLCMNHIQEIKDNYQTALNAGFEIVIVSMDPKDKAQASTKDIALTVPVGYGLTEAMARSWGLYISGGRDGTNEPTIYSEPGLFVIRPDTTVLMALVPSLPFSRPIIPQLIGGLRSYAIQNNYPARVQRTKCKFPCQRKLHMLCTNERYLSLTYLQSR
jgi:peroxiredoxin